MSFLVDRIMSMDTVVIAHKTVKIVTNATINNQFRSVANSAQKPSVAPKVEAKQTQLSERAAARREVAKITIRQLAIAVAKAEGWETQRSVAQRNSNPCNIRKICTSGMSSGFGKCKTEEDGWKLCESSLNWYISRGKTLAQMMRYFSPTADGNNPSKHASNIAAFAGINKYLPLKELIK
jgi:hypothetical protein